MAGLVPVSGAGAENGSTVSIPKAHRVIPPASAGIALQLPRQTAFCTSGVGTLSAPPLQLPETPSVTVSLGC